MATTHQVMTLSPHYDGYHYVVIYNSSLTVNPYILYRKWYNMGWHRKKVAQYGNLDSCLFHLLQSKYPQLG